MDDLRSILIRIEQDVKELKADMKDQLKQVAAHNEILRTHEQRSISLQEQHAVAVAKMSALEKEQDARIRSVETSKSNSDLLFKQAGYIVGIIVTGILSGIIAKMFF